MLRQFKESTVSGRGGSLDRVATLLLIRTYPPLLAALRRSMQEMTRGRAVLVNNGTMVHLQVDASSRQCIAALRTRERMRLMKESTLHESDSDPIEMIGESSLSTV